MYRKTTRLVSMTAINLCLLSPLAFAEGLYVPYANISVDGFAVQDAHPSFLTNHIISKRPEIYCWRR